MNNETYIVSCVSVLVVYFTFLLLLHVHNERNWREFQRNEAAFRAAYPHLASEASYGN